MLYSKSHCLIVTVLNVVLAGSVQKLNASLHLSATKAPGV